MIDPSLHPEWSVTPKSATPEPWWDRNWWIPIVAFYTLLGGYMLWSGRR